VRNRLILVGSLALAVLCLASCPVEVPTTGSLPFRCHEDAECAVGYTCAGRICVLTGTDAGLLVAEAGSDAQGADAAALDTSASDTSAPDTSALDTSALDTSALDTSALDTSALDTSALDTSALDTSALDTSVPDTATPDNSTPDTTGFDAGSTWLDPDFGQRLKLSFDNNASGEDLVDFTVWVRLSSSHLDLNAIHNGGADLRFFDADGAGPLDHELARLDADQLEVWVEVPRIDAGSTTDHIWLYFDAPSASSVADPAGVWSNGYVGVWHLDQSPVGSGVVTDSLGQHHGTSQGNMTQDDLVDGQLTGAVNFDGSDDAIDLGDLGSNDWTGLTVAAWAYAESTADDPRIVCKSPTTSTNDHVYAILHQGSYVRVRMITDGSGGGSTGSIVSESVISTDSWVYAVTTWSASSARTEVYLDGINRGGAGRDGDSLDNSSQETFIGNVNAIHDRWFDGPIDEVRIASVARSADWVRAQHRSMLDDFVTASAVEARP